MSENNFKKADEMVDAYNAKATSQTAGPDQMSLGEGLPIIIEMFRSLRGLIKWLKPKWLPFIDKLIGGQVEP